MKRRNIPCANLWVPVPFYLVSSYDPASYNRVIEFLNHRLNLGLDLSDLDDRARILNEKIAGIRITSPEVNGNIEKMENNQRLAEEEGEKLVGEIEELLRTEDDE